MTFRGEQVAVRWITGANPSFQEQMAMLFDGMIQRHVNRALDRVPVYGHWRRFRRWRKDIRNAKALREAERERRRDAATVEALFKKWGQQILPDGAFEE